MHIPRTGGTSVSRLLYGRNLAHHSARRWALLFGTRFDSWCRFAILRDPVERFLSAYRFTLQGGSELILNSRFEMARLAPMEPFEGFLERMEQGPRYARRIPMFRPQAEFVCDASGRLMVDRLFVIDRSPKHAAALTRWLNVPALPRLNASYPHGVHVDARTRQRILALYSDDDALYRKVVAAGGELVVNAAAMPRRAPEKLRTGD